MKHRTIPIFIPESACPHRCAYCNQYHISGQHYIETPAEIKKKIHTYMSTIKDAIVELGFFGGSFTGLPFSIQEEYLQVAQPFLSEGKIHSIRLSTRPDYISKEILTLLRQYHVETIELGAQSTHEHVLESTQRGHSVDDIRNATRQIKEFGFRLGLQMMIGLPKDTFEQSLQTAQLFIAWGADDVRIYPTIVIPHTLLAEWYRRGMYVPLSLDEAVNQTAEILLLFEQAGVKVIRVGLHPSEGLINGTDLLAGPFHVSFRELVETKIWKNILSAIPADSSKFIEISVSPKYINYAIGYGSENRKWLSSLFAGVSFISDNALENRNFNYTFHHKDTSMVK